MAEVDWTKAGAEERAKEVLARLATCREQQAPVLDLAGLLDDESLPEELREFTWLRELNVSSSHQLTVLSPLSGLRGLTELNCSRTQVTDLSPLSELYALTTLHCGITQVTDLSPLSELYALTTLHCGITQVTDLSPLSKLYALTTLHCGITQITDLSPLSKLHGLTELNCGSTQVTDLSPLSKLHSLTHLYCFGMQITDLSPLSQLHTLTMLHCSFTQVMDLSPLSQSHALTTLDCSFTQVMDLSLLSKFRGLTELNCSCTQVTDLSPMSELEALTTLRCRHTNVTDLSPLSQLDCLKTLDCALTQVTDLSPLSELHGLTTLDCRGTPIAPSDSNIEVLRRAKTLYFDGGCDGSLLQRLPRELFGGEHDDCAPRVRGFLADLARGEGTLSEATAILVGNAFAGKTTLARALLTGKPAEQDAREGPDGTHGIVMATLPLPTREYPDLSLQLWDFAGQDLYHATHRLFFRDGALYLLLWTAYEDPSDSTPKEERHPLGYWVNLIRQMAGRHRLLLVQTKLDQLPCYAKPAGLPSDLDARTLNISATSHAQEHLDEMNRLRLELELGAAALLRQRCTRLPASWLAARDALVERRGERFIELTEFESMAEKLGVCAPMVLLGYLHETGNVFHKPGTFGSRVVLDQSWAIQHIYRLYDPTGEARFGESSRQCAQRLMKDPGYITGANTERFWPEADAQSRSVYVDFMLGAEMAFELRKGPRAAEFAERRFVLPGLLPIFDDLSVPLRAMLEQEWEHVDPNEWRIQLKFGFFHRGMLQRIIVRLSTAAPEIIRWRDGLRMVDGETGSTIRWDYCPTETGHNVLRLRLRHQNPAQIARFVPLMRALVREVTDGQEPKISVGLGGGELVAIEDLETGARLESGAVDYRRVASAFGFQIPDKSPYGVPGADTNGLAPSLPRGAQSASETHDDVRTDTLAPVPESFGDYKVLRKIGQGMAEVFLVEKGALRKALKTFRGADPRKLRLFEQEVYKLAALDHPGIVPIHDAELEASPQYFTMPYYENARTITQYAADMVLDVNARARLIVTVCEAVECAHARGLAHLDIKPDNVIVDKHGQPKLLDFGLATLLSDQVPGFGSLAYMSPERLDPKMVNDAPKLASDQYALALVLWELLGRELPNSAARFGRWFVAEKDSELDQILSRALKPDPSDRYPSVADFRRALQAHLDGTPKS